MHSFYPTFSLFLTKQNDPKSFPAKTKTFLCIRPRNEPKLVPYWALVFPLQ